MILLDMDGVIADFAGASCKLHGQPPVYDCWNYFEKWGISEDEFWAPINAAGRDFWANLDDCPGADELIAEVSRIDPEFHICTKPSHDPMCMAGKLDWIKRKFGSQFRRYIFTPNKSLLSRPGRMLVDDSDENITEWAGGGGDYALVPQPWNMNADMVDSRLPFVLNTLKGFEREVMALGR